MKTTNLKVALASILFAGAMMTSCKDNHNSSESEGTESESMQNGEAVNGQGTVNSGSADSGTATDTTATSNQDGSGAGAQPTVPGGTSTGSGTGGDSNQRP